MKRVRSFMKSLLVVAAVALVVPLSAGAGSLEPSAAPAPTMRTLQEIYDKVSSLNHFSVNPPDFASVTDNWTGLTWEKSPRLENLPWYTALGYCAGLNLGGKSGWRMPTKGELTTLLDSAQTSPALPPGHPFVDIGTHIYWSSTRYEESGTDYWIVHLRDGFWEPCHTSTGYNQQVW